MSISDTTISTIRDTAPGVVVERVGDADVLRVLVPSARWAHDYLTISMERSDAGWLLSDMGAISRLAGDEATDLVDLLECAGGEFELEADGYLMTGVDHDDDLATRVLSFAHFISAAPIVWHASQCNHDEVQPRPESTARALAKAMRLRLITRIGKPAATLIRLDKRVAGHGESVKVPMAIAPSSPLSAPLLLASFIDMAAAPQAVVAAKRGMTFTYQVARDLRIPKFVVIDGDERDLEHMAELLDPLDVATILFDDPELLEAESRVAIEQLGFATTGRPE